MKRKIRKKKKTEETDVNLKTHWEHNMLKRAELRMKWDFVVGAWAKGLLSDNTRAVQFKIQLAAYCNSNRELIERYSQLLEVIEPNHRMKDTLLYKVANAHGQLEKENRLISPGLEDIKDENKVNLSVDCCLWPHYTS